MTDISQYSFQLARYAYNGLRSLKHANSGEVVRIHAESGFHDNTHQGPTIALSILDSQGRDVGFSKVSYWTDTLPMYLVSLPRQN